MKHSTRFALFLLVLSLAAAAFVLKERRMSKWQTG